MKKIRLSKNLKTIVTWLKITPLLLVPLLSSCGNKEKSLVDGDNFNRCPNPVYPCAALAEVWENYTPDTCQGNFVLQWNLQQSELEEQRKKHDSQ